jgi:hypothetical protein
MNNPPFGVRDQALILGLFVISSHKIQLRCICRLWVFIATSNYKQYGTYFEDTSATPFEAFNKIIFQTWQGRDSNRGPLEL